MTRATKIKQARQRATPVKPESRLPRGALILAILGVAGLVAAGALLWSSSGGEDEAAFEGVPEIGRAHV